MMKALQRFWRDNSASNVSSAVLATGILGVLLASFSIGVGFAADGSPISEFARMLRQLDQSFTVPRREAGEAWTAPSRFTDSAPVPESTPSTILQVAGEEQAATEPEPPAGTVPAQPAHDETAKAVRATETMPKRFSRKWFKPPKDTPNNGQPIFASKTFYHAEPFVIEESQAIASITVSLAESAEVHMRASTSLIAFAPNQTATMQFLAESSGNSVEWGKSIRIVTLSTPHQHVNVNIDHGIRLEPGEYTIHWMIRPSAPDGRVAVHAGGALLLQAFPTQ
jgi:hypothetical protein